MTRSETLDLLKLLTGETSWLLTGPEGIHGGDTLCDPNHPILLEHQVRLKPSSACRLNRKALPTSKLEQTLTLLAKEDPTFRWNLDGETDERSVSGMGVLHLEVKCNQSKTTSFNCNWVKLASATGRFVIPRDCGAN